MKAIWKYPLAFEDSQVIKMPKGAKILSAQNQPCGGVRLCVWAVVDTEAELENRVIEVFPTGLPISNGNLSFIGTIQQQEGCLTWHVFERLGGAA